MRKMKGVRDRERDKGDIERMIRRKQIASTHAYTLLASLPPLRG